MFPLSLVHIIFKNKYISNFYCELCSKKGISTIVIDNGINLKSDCEHYSEKSSKVKDIGELFGFER